MLGDRDRIEAAQWAASLLYHHLAPVVVPPEVTTRLSKMDAKSESASVSQAAAVWPDPPPAELAGDGWLSLSDEERSIARDLREIFREELWRYRGLAYELTRRDIRIRYKQTILGFAWAVLMPMLVVMAGATVRYAMAYIGGRHLGIPDLAGIAIKAVPWSFFVGSMGFAATSLVGQANLVTKIYFPREVLPLAATMAQAFDACIGIASLFVAFLLLGIHPGLAASWAPALALLAFMLTAGLALLVSCANLFYRDVKYVVQVLLMFGIFFTPVFFEPEMFGSLGARLMMLNPLAPIMEGLRYSVVLNVNLLDTIVVQGRHGAVLAWSPWYLAYSAACALIAFLAGLLVFHRAESKFAEYV
jgi:ABC-type polysaccharide/polyol phosphate export permease